MALTKEQMREYMRKKRAAKKLKVDSEFERRGEVVAGDVPGGVLDEMPVVEPMTETDRKFEARNPGYWIYGKEVKERECWMCGEAFETRLELNKFCGPSCKEEWLTDAFGKLRVKA